MGDNNKRYPMAGWVSDAWQAYSFLGIGDSDVNAVGRRIILSNRVAAVVFVLGLGVTLYFLRGDHSALTLYWFVFLLGAVWAMPFLNALGSTSLSRHILSSLMPLFMVGIVAHTRIATPDEVHGASFYIPRFYLMAVSFFPLLLFTQSEKWRMYISFAINILILLFFNELLDLFGAGMGLLEPRVAEAFFISISSVISLGIIASGYFFLNELNNAYEHRIVELLKDSEEKNRRIQSAISYARNIQQTVMPLKELEQRLSDRLFTVFRPLDVVSGDFYLLRDEGRHLLFGVIDCTGHGVPGAFVSLLANSALQRAVKEHGAERPSVILGEANRLLHSDLDRSGNPDVQDGMDIALCSLDRETLQLNVSGANLSVFVVQGGRAVVHACDRGAISRGRPERVFNGVTVQLHAGDMVYLTTDGLPDQFGGPKDRRFGKRAMADRFITLSSLPIPEQRQTLLQFFEEWKGENPQVDDVCVMGLRM